MLNTVYELGRSGKLEPIKVEGFEMGQPVWYEGDRCYAWVVGSDNMGYHIITEDLLKHTSQRANSLSPFTRIKPRDGETLTAEGIADLERRLEEKHAADRIRAAEAAKEHAIEVERITNELRARYPAANNRTPGKSLKAELTKAFPGVKFSVRSDYDSINISWTDGPTVKQVEEYSQKYQSGSFNGMEDIYEYDRSAYADAQSTVLGSVRWVSENRSVSKNILEAITADLRAKGRDADEYGSEAHKLTFGVEIYGAYSGLELIDHNYVPQFTQKAPEAKETPAKTIQPVEGVTVRENEERGGVEIKFTSKPASEILVSLKANGFRWSKFQGLWYNRATEEAKAFAYSLV